MNDNFQDCVKQAAQEAAAELANPEGFGAAPGGVSGPIADAVLAPIAETVAQLVATLGPAGARLFFKKLASLIPF